MARRIPNNLSQKAKSTALHLAGWREFNGADVHSMKRIIQYNKDVEKLLSDKRKELKKGPPLRGAQAKWEQRVLRHLKSERRDSFDKVVYHKGENGDPLMIGKGYMKKAKLEVDFSDPEQKRNFELTLLAIHKQKLEALRKQKKPNLP